LKKKHQNMFLIKNYKKHKNIVYNCGLFLFCGREGKREFLWLLGWDEMGWGHGSAFQARLRKYQGSPLVFWPGLSVPWETDDPIGVDLGQLH